MPAELLHDLLSLLVELSILCGLLGAMVYMFLRTLAIELWAYVEKTEWYMDWEDRHYVRRFNEDMQQVQAFKAAAVRRQSQQGRITPAAAFWLVALVLALLAACATPEPALSGSDQWWSDIKRGW